MLKNILLTAFLCCSFSVRSANNESHLPSVDKVIDACNNLAIFMSYAATAGTVYIDPKVPKQEYWGRGISTDDSFFKQMRKASVSAGKKLLMKEDEVDKKINYFYKNQDAALYLKDNNVTDALKQECIINPKRYISTYQRLESAGMLN